MIASILAAHLALAADPASSSTIVLTPEQAAAATEAAKHEGDGDQSWYGWEILLADGLAGTCVVTAASLGFGGASPGQVLLLSGVAIYSFGGPLLHFRRDRWAVGLIDIAMRVLILPVGFLVSLAASAPFALAGSAVLAAGVDAFGLAWEPPRSAKPAHASIQWAPFAGAVRGAPMAGVAGAF